MKQLQVDIEVSTGRIFSTHLPIEDKEAWINDLKIMLSGDNTHLVVESE